MVPLLNNVGYQLIYLHFFRKCEYIKFKFKLHSLTVFGASCYRKAPPPPPPPPRCANFPPTIMFNAINNGNLIFFNKVLNDRTVQYIYQLVLNDVTKIRNNAEQHLIIWKLKINSDK